MLYYDGKGEGEEDDMTMEVGEETEGIALATLEVMNLHDPQPLDVDLSINSMVRLDSPKTMKLLSTVGGRNVVVLIDSDASYNFIKE